MEKVMNVEDEWHDSIDGRSTIQPCMEYCCHVWASAPSCYLDLLDKLQKRICRTVGPSLTASLEPLAHR